MNKACDLEFFPKGARSAQRPRRADRMLDLTSRVPAAAGAEEIIQLLQGGDVRQLGLRHPGPDRRPSLRRSAGIRRRAHHP